MQKSMNIVGLFSIIFMMLQIEHRALLMLGEHATADLQSQLMSPVSNRKM